MRFILALLVCLIGGPALADDVRIPPTKDPAAAAPMLQSTAAEASHVFKAAPGNLYSFGANNTSATTGFIMLIDGTVVPGDGALTACGASPATGCLKACYPIAAGTATLPAFTGFQVTPGPPIPFAFGIVAVYSTTGCFSKTLGGNNIFFEAQTY